MYQPYQLVQKPLKKILILGEDAAEEVSTVATLHQLSESLDSFVQLPSQITMITIALKENRGNVEDLKKKYEIIKQTKILCICMEAAD